MPADCQTPRLREEALSELGARAGHDGEGTDARIAHRLAGQLLPPVLLPSTDGLMVELRSLSAGRAVLYGYPRTSEPGKPAPTDWDVIPGARGCTPQACAFRDHHAELRHLGADVFGLSTQSTAYQKEMVARLHLPFAVLSDSKLEFVDALGLPTFTVDGVRLVKRITLILRGPTIEAVLYPVLQPERNAEDVLTWLAAHPL